MLTSADPISAPVARSQPRGLLMPPQMLSNGIEVSLHQCPRALQSELQLVMPERKADLAGCTIVASAQHARCDLVKIGPDIEAEKDRLLETVRFVAICTRYTCPFPVQVNLQSQSVLLLYMPLAVRVMGHFIM